MSIYVCQLCGEKYHQVEGAKNTVCWSCATEAKSDAMKSDGDGPYMTEDEQMEQDDRREDARIEQELNNDLYSDKEVLE